MAEQIIRRLVDDVDGTTTEDVQRVTLGWDGATYEVDLSPERRSEVETFLRPYLTAGRRVRTQNRARAGTSSSATSPAAAERQAVRTWASEQGIEVPRSARVRRSWGAGPSRPRRAPGPAVAGSRDTEPVPVPVPGGQDRAGGVRQGPPALTLTTRQRHVGIPLPRS